MSASNTSERSRSRGANYIGVLRRTLRDLTGYSVLAYELIQNADDAAGATAMTLDVRDDALIVWNDGQFDDCGDQDVVPDECAWRTSRGRRCDFHSFRNVSGGDKASRDNTTGAFGIGFTAVYQITDAPQLISSGRHWFVDELREEGDRIREHDDCPNCRGERGTRFILPWARDPTSRFREATGAAIVGPTGPADLLSTLVSVVPAAMLFLKAIRKITVMDNGVARPVFTREEADGDILIGDGTSDQLWRVYPGDFRVQADARRDLLPRDVEKRRTKVSVAVPAGGAADGRLFAYLPTEEATSLPFSINADFFPMSDRKRLLTDGQGGEWNRLAIRTAADVVADHLEDLTAVLGPQGVWKLLRSALEISSPTTSASRGLALESFWERLLERLPTARIAFTSREEWETPTRVFLALESSEQDSFGVLEALGLKMLHPDLRGSAFQLPRGKFGLATLALDHVVTVLQESGLFGRRSGLDVPTWLVDSSTRAVLFREIEVLIAREGKGGVRTIGQLAQITLGPGRDGAAWPLDDLYRCDDEAWEVFGPLASNRGFLDPSQMPPDVPRLTALAHSFDVAAAIDILSSVGNNRLIELQTTGMWNGQRAIAWLARNEQAVLEDEDLVAALVQLAIFPSPEGPRTLRELALPGDFTDPMGLAGLVDREKAGDHVSFFQRLGARELTFLSYVTETLPRAASSATEEQWTAAMELVATRLGEIADKDAAQHVLSELPAVRCLNGGSAFVVPLEAYFAGEQLTAVLGASYVQAIVPPDRHESFVRFYEWLGVARHPRPADIVRRISGLVATPPTSGAKGQIAAIVDYLGTYWEADSVHATMLAFLHGKSWLPARGDSKVWHRPAELCLPFQDYLFASQARFIDLPYPALTAARDLLARLGSRDVPTTEEVVRHLLHCSEHDAPVNLAVYTTLNQRADDAAIDELVGRSCLRLDDRWVAPDWVFWGEQPFGRFRGSLGPAFRSYSDLLDRLRVKESPGFRDAIGVLGDLADEFGPANTPIEDSSDRSVYDSCWRLLDEALAEETADQDMIGALDVQKVVLDGHSVLTRPSLVLFDDMPGLAERFDERLQINLVRRPASGWRAMMVAGVRNLSDAVTTSVVEIGDRYTNDALRTILIERSMSLLRAVSPFVSISPRAFDYRVRSVHLLATQRLVIQGTLHGTLGRFDFHTQPYSADALYVDHDDTLYVVPSGVGNAPLATSRELLRKIAPEVPLGSAAASASLVLTAHSAEAAENVLDEAGVPRLATDVGPVAPVAVIQEFGGIDQPDDFYPTLEPRPDAEPASAEPVDTREGGGQLARGAWDHVGAKDVPLPKGGGELKEPDAPVSSGRPGRPGGQAPTRGQSDGGGTDDRTGAEGRGNTAHTGTGHYPDPELPSGPRSRLRSYVVSDDDSFPEDADANDKSDERSRVDAAGIAAVLAYEQGCGRAPREMPKNNPGYDVESLLDGEVERYIEVKAVSGAWDSLGVALSNTQFIKGQSSATEYWLYVVEYALSADSRIYRIQDPSRRVDQFFFDNGWIGAAESDE